MTGMMNIHLEQLLWCDHARPLNHTHNVADIGCKIQTLITDGYIPMLWWSNHICTLPVFGSEITYRAVQSAKWEGLEDYFPKLG